MRYDTKGYGYVDSDQVNLMMNEIDPQQHFDRTHLMESIGFNDQKIITFSELVRSLSAQFISRDEETINLLQYIYLMSSDD